MSKRKGLVLCLLALTALTGAIFFAGKTQRSSAQNYLSYELKVSCGNVRMPNQFWYNVEGDKNSMGVSPARCAGNCGGRIVTLEEALAGLPPSVQDGLRRKVENASANDVGCVTGQSPGKADEKCGKPTPWFDGSIPCTDIQNPVIAKGAGDVTLSMCGVQIFRWLPPNNDDPLLLDAYANVLRSWVASRVGNKICCLTMRNAARSGDPCDPSVDIDCDGKPNKSDLTTHDELQVPDINMPTTQNGTGIDPFPPDLDPNDVNFRPERTARNSKGVGVCACKWELIKGDMKCGSRLRNHIYTATWRCPSTGAEVFTTKRFPGNTPCKNSPKRKSSSATLPKRRALHKIT